MSTRLFMTAEQDVAEHWGHVVEDERHEDGWWEALSPQERAVHLVFAHGVDRSMLHGLMIDEALVGQMGALHAQRHLAMEPNRLGILIEHGIPEVEASTALAHYGDDSPLGKTFTALIDAVIG